ncbi:MAG: phage major capsid protein [Gammaproteobacteria bacterium]|nr:phage major capsid protein [Gammaproteobacteria bacterium]
MANTSVTYSYDDFTTATANKCVKKRFMDVVSRGSPFLMFMMKGDRYKAGVTGKYIEEPLMTELSDNGKWYSGAETVDTNQQNVGTAAFYEPKQYINAITITGEEERRNKGKEQIIRLLDAKTKQAMITARSQIADALWEDGSGTKQIQGLPAMIPDDRGAATAYGQITAAAAQPWWYCQGSRTEAGVYGDVGDFNTNFRDFGVRLFHDCSEGASTPNVHLVDQGMQEAYEKTLAPYERHESKEARDLGYANELTFMKVPVLWDRKHPDNRGTTHRWYMLNTEFATLRFSPDANFKVLGFQRPANADFRTSPVVWHGALTTDNRRMHGVLTGITL